ncbi:MAG: hypothetical protein AAF346_14970 [Pseudomonadota bacterium]
MNGRYVRSERLVALFLFAVLLFTPPLILIFDSNSTVLGFPALYLYLFIAWGILIALLALIIEFSTHQTDDDAEQEDLSESGIDGWHRTGGSES